VTVGTTKQPGELARLSAAPSDARHPAGGRGITFKGIAGLDLASHDRSLFIAKVT